MWNFTESDGGTGATAGFGPLQRKSHLLFGIAASFHDPTSANESEEITSEVLLSNGTVYWGGISVPIVGRDSPQSDILMAPALPCA